jgi:hypothetical protein
MADLGPRGRVSRGSPSRFHPGSSANPGSISWSKGLARPAASPATRSRRRSPSSGGSGVRPAPSDPKRTRGGGGNRRASGSSPSRTEGRGAGVRDGKRSSAPHPRATRSRGGRSRGPTGPSTRRSPRSNGTSESIRTPRSSVADPRDHSDALARLSRIEEPPVSLASRPSAKSPWVRKLSVSMRTPEIVSLLAHLGGRLRGAPRSPTPPEVRGAAVALGPTPCAIYGKNR